ncbi:hypothetical protein ACWT_0373 [Actinoplanes sp. SE50]|uniref:hypothetical protein n=1 Tax=unclassified Actinoplanes TaxID=2626549 RepID=UPI00023EC3C6|nr:MULTISPECIES: hypothetical protein [unclassified Actinoplanes]AEV81385.1 hypothetical protein ACPL_488 [Actinoplanes sp. SE50/110]ATO79788.1 hypothetical protein ACWT_0373 [Actinoplanes sp. SE50]SLL97190.1 hypothetical protein ACSP50_0387 [Actinoplanes sp. SE50/110]
MRAVRTISLALVLVLGPPLAACSSGHGAEAWAAAVCGTLRPWRSEISSLTSRTQQQMTTRTTPGQAKENLARLFDGARSASETARAGVERAGVPDVTDGKKIADAFVGSLAGMRDAYGSAHDGIQALATAPSASFYTEVGKVVDRLNSEYEQSGLDTSKLDSVELRRAFESLPECQ